MIGVKVGGALIDRSSDTMGGVVGQEKPPTRIVLDMPGIYTPAADVANP
jgi:hypothetical protein